MLHEIRECLNVKINSSFLVLVVSLCAASASMAGDDYVPSLLTDTPYEGRQLAIKLARKSIGEMQSDPAVKKKVRAEYATSGATLIEAAEVIAIEFSTIAAANNYWRQ